MHSEDIENLQSAQQAVRASFSVPIIAFRRSSTYSTVGRCTVDHAPREDRRFVPSCADLDCITCVCDQAHSRLPFCVLLLQHFKVRVAFNFLALSAAITSNFWDCDTKLSSFKLN